MANFKIFDFFSVSFLTFDPAGRILDRKRQTMEHGTNQQRHITAMQGRRQGGVQVDCQAVPTTCVFARNQDALRRGGSQGHRTGHFHPRMAKP